MKRNTAKVITISDLIEWNQKKELELSPKYQRNTVWNETAKAYLIDTIIRGLPIPPIFLRQTVDITTKTTTREIIDGQQRVRAIIEYVVSESFALRRNHNKKYGGKYYNDLPDDVKEDILEYEILAEVVTEKDDSIIYDMFARLNSNNVVLNKQEVRNAKYWGDFKVLVYKLSAKYRDFFLDQGIFNDKDCGRMRDVELMNSMVIYFSEGITLESPTIVDKIYEKYDADFPNDDEIEDKIYSVMSVLDSVYAYFNGQSGCFGNKNYFFTLYCAIANQMFGCKNENLERSDLFSKENINQNGCGLNSKLAQFIIDYDNNVIQKNTSLSSYQQFEEFRVNNSSHTTGKTERKSRISFLNHYLCTGNYDSARS